MKYVYCPTCGKKLTSIYSFDEGNVPSCDHCKILYFDTPKPTVVVAVIKGDKILLLKQSYIYKNSKVLVSGYVSQGETVEETVGREVLEETGIAIKDIKYLGSCSIPEKELLMLTYMANYCGGDLVKSQEVEGVEWVKISDALSQMEEDVVGRAVVKRVLHELSKI